eukprot:gene12957-3794_t
MSSTVTNINGKTVETIHYEKSDPPKLDNASYHVWECVVNKSCIMPGNKSTRHGGDKHGSKTSPSRAPHQGRLEQKEERKRFNDNNNDNIVAAKRADSMSARSVHREKEGERERGGREGEDDHLSADGLHRVM